LKVIKAIIIIMYASRGAAVHIDFPDGPGSLNVRPDA